MRDQNKGNKHIHIPSGPRFKGMGDLQVRGGGLRVRVGLGWLREGADLSGGHYPGGRKAQAADRALH